MEFFRPTELREIISLAFFSYLVPCGFPSPAANYIGQRIDPGYHNTKALLKVDSIRVIK
ncbi:umuDC operon protein-like protein [Salmonella enterica subsp. houtenae]|nr:umuDC operon protein-like protein [Salmonella enterica subsp. houtenae]